MSIRRPNEALSTAAAGGRSLRAVLAAGREKWKRIQAEREHERTKGWIPMGLSMIPPLHPEAAVWYQEMVIVALGNPTAHDPLLRAELKVDRDIVQMFNEDRLQYAEIVIVRQVTPRELWNMQNNVWNKLAALYRDMAATIDELFLMFKGNDNPDIKKQQDEIDKYVSHKHYYTAMGLAVNRLLAIADDLPPKHDDYGVDNNHTNEHAIKTLALRTFKQRWYIKAGQAALLEAVSRHLAASTAPP